MVFTTECTGPNVAGSEELTCLRTFVSDDCDDPLLDVERAIETFGGNVDAFRGVVRVFLAYLPDAVAALSKATDARELIPLLHNLGSSFGTVGAMRAYRLSRAMEARLRRGDTQGMAESAVLLQAVVRTSIEMLRATVALDHERPAGPPHCV